MTNRIIILIIAFFIVSCNNKKELEESGKIPNANNVFTTIDYDKVVAYSYDGEGDVEIIDKSGNLAEKIKKQSTLNKFQITKLTNAICDKSTYGGDIAACFDPHFGIVFYKKNKVVAYVSICLDCNYLISSVKIPFDGGFSNDGIKKIEDFEKELNFFK